ncbi:MAG: L-threonylcarbamoyladenylate synthase [Alphaproteobacteria bacterium]
MDRIDAHIPSRDIKRAAQLLREGRLVAFGTETVYGLGADATNDRAVAQIFAAKSRPQFNPLISHVADINAARALAKFDPPAEKLATAFWPGPFTLVLPQVEQCSVSKLVTAGLPTIAIRVPAHPAAHAMLAHANRPIAAPSANPSGAISPTKALHVRQGLADKVDFILDGGPATHGLESTIVAVLDGAVTLLRPGSITQEMIESTIGYPIKTGADSETVPTAPGQLKSHYAPNKALRLNAETFNEGEAILSFGPAPQTERLFPLSETGDLIEAAANLFAQLHAADASSARAIAVMPIPDEGLGCAINDRLTRAAAPRGA